MSEKAAMRSAVFVRDGGCVAARLDLSHTCKDRWGEEHGPTELAKMTWEHVKQHGGGMRRDEYGWTLTLCHDANVNDHWCSANAELCRAYLMGVRAQQSRGRM